MNDNKPEVNFKEGWEKESQSAQVGSMMAGKGEDITMRVKAEVDGEEVMNREGDSLTWGFVYNLLRQMRGFKGRGPEC